MSVAIKFKAHPGQKEIISKRKRYNTINTGRQAGKTTLAKYLIIETAVTDREQVGYFVPQYNLIKPIWDSLVSKCKAIILKKDWTAKTIKFRTNGEVEFWSMENQNAGRSRTYKRVIIDEGSLQKNLLEIIDENLLATLAIKEGDFYAFGTPKGLKNDWYKLCHDKTYAHFELDSTANPAFSQKELAVIKSKISEKVFLQEYKAKFVELNENAFLNYFDWNLHTAEQLEWSLTDRTILCFDFNYDDTTATILQIDKEEMGLKFMKEFRVVGGTRALCLAIKKWCSENKKDYAFWVTGDRNGNRKETNSNSSDYEIIRQVLSIPYTRFYDTRSMNFQHSFSRDIINECLMYNLIKICRKGCPDLAIECLSAIPTAEGGLHKDSKDHKNNLFDGFRYGVHSQFASIKMVQIFAKRIFKLEK